MATLNLTPIQERILNLFKDGLPHTRQEICDAVDSEGFCSPKNMRTHLSILRRKLQTNQEDIVCVIQGRENGAPKGLMFRYMHVGRPYFVSTRE